MSTTSVLDYLMLLKQIKNVPPEVKTVATNEINEIKKSRIHIPDATIRSGFYKSNKKAKRNNDRIIRDEDDNGTIYSDETLKQLTEQEREKTLQKKFKQETGGGASFFSPTGQLPFDFPETVYI